MSLRARAKGEEAQKAGGGPPAALDPDVSGPLGFRERTTLPQHGGQRLGIGLDRGVRLLGAAAGELDPPVRHPGAETVLAEAQLVVRAEAVGSAGIEYDIPATELRQAIVADPHGATFSITEVTARS